MQYPPRTPAAARVGGGQDNAQGCRWRVQSCCPQGDTAGGGRQAPVRRPRTAAAHMPERHGPLPDPRWTGDRGRNGRRRLPDVLPHRDGTGHGVRRVTCWPRTTAAIPGGGPDSGRCNAACGLDGSCLRAVLLRRKKSATPYGWLIMCRASPRHCPATSDGTGHRIRGGCMPDTTRDRVAAIPP